MSQPADADRDAYGALTLRQLIMRCESRSIDTKGAETRTALAELLRNHDLLNSASKFGLGAGAFDASAVDSSDEVQMAAISAAAGPPPLRSPPALPTEASLEANVLTNVPQPCPPSSSAAAASAGFSLTPNPNDNGNDTDAGEEFFFFEDAEGQVVQDIRDAATEAAIAATKADLEEARSRANSELHLGSPAEQAQAGSPVGALQPSSAVPGVAHGPNGTTQIVSSTSSAPEPASGSPAAVGVHMLVRPRFTISAAVPVDKRFTAYVVRITQAVSETDIKTRSILRRYSEFHTLHERLKRDFGSLRMAGCKLPKKKRVGSSMGTAFVARRCAKLERYLNEVASNLMPELALRNYWREFIEDPTVADARSSKKRTTAVRVSSDRARMSMARLPGSARLMTQVQEWEAGTALLDLSECSLSATQSTRSTKSGAATATAIPAGILLSSRTRETDALDLGSNCIGSAQGDLGLGPFHNLTRLVLSHNDLTVLPPDLFQSDCTAKLKELDLSFNMLQLLPDSFSKLIGLHKLQLDENRLASIQVLARMAGLQHVSVSRNQLQELPSPATAPLWGDQLQMFNAGLNQIAHVPDKLRNLVGKVLFIPGNPCEAVASNSVVQVEYSSSEGLNVVDENQPSPESTTDPSTNITAPAVVTTAKDSQTLVLSSAASTEPTAAAVNVALPSRNSEYEAEDFDEFDFDDGSRPPSVAIQLPIVPDHVASPTVSDSIAERPVTLASPTSPHNFQRRDEEGAVTASDVEESDDSSPFRSRTSQQSGSSLSPEKIQQLREWAQLTITNEIRPAFQKLRSSLVLCSDLSTAVELAVVVRSLKIPTDRAKQEPFWAPVAEIRSNLPNPTLASADDRLGKLLNTGCFVLEDLNFTLEALCVLIERGGVEGHDTTGVNQVVNAGRVVTELRGALQSHNLVPGDR